MFEGFYLASKLVEFLPFFVSRHLGAYHVSETLSFFDIYHLFLGLRQLAFNSRNLEVSVVDIGRIIQSSAPASSYPVFKSVLLGLARTSETRNRIDLSNQSLLFGYCKDLLYFHAGLFKSLLVALFQAGIKVLACRSGQFCDPSAFLLLWSL